MAIQSNVDAFLLLEDQSGPVKGETADKAHKETIQIHHFRFGVNMEVSPSVGGGLGAGKAVFKEFEFQVHASKASPVLFKNACIGMHHPKATLYIRKAGGKPQDYYVWTFEELVMTKYELECSDDIIETVAFAYRKVGTEYKPQKTDGSLDSGIKAEYDQKSNEPS